MKREQMVALGILVFVVLISALVPIFVADIWDKKTQSAAEYASITREIERDTGNILEEFKKDLKTTQSLLSDLKKTNYSAALYVDMLTERFGNLDAKIDSSGKCVNFSSVEKIIELKMGERFDKIKKKFEEIDTRDERAAYMKKKGSEWFTTEHGAGKEFDKMQKAKQK